MPFLHLDSKNRYKEAWRDLVKDHPCHFEVLEWSIDQDRDLIQRAFPDLDTQLYPRTCISILASLQKLVDYGGIAVRGEDIEPIRGLRIVLEDWKTFGCPKSLTVRGYAYPVFVDKSTIMTAPEADPVCTSYRDQLVRLMLNRKWEHPVFGSDVAIM